MAGRPKKVVDEVIADAIAVGNDDDPIFPTGLMGEFTTPVNEDEEEITNEEETQEETTEEVIETEPEATNDETESSTIKILANYLREEGIVDFKDEDFKDEESFINEVIENRIDAGIDEYKETLPDVIKELIDNYEEGVPLGELLGVKVNNENYLKLTQQDLTDNEVKQKNVVREYYKRLGWKEDKISAKIEKLEARADLEDTSIEILDELKELLEEEESNYKEQTKKAEAQKLQQYEQAKVDFKTNLDKKEEIFKGLKLNQKQKDTLFNGIFVADKEGKNELIKKIEKDPDYNLKVAYMTLVLDWDLSALEKLASTKAAKGLRDAIEGQKDRLGGLGLNANKSTGQRFDAGVAKGALSK